jgi:hypothetical protein
MTYIYTQIEAILGPLRPPDVGQEFTVGQNLAFVTRKKAYQPVFDRREADLNPSLLNRA